MTAATCRHLWTHSLIAGSLGLAFAVAGCSRKERVLDVDAPGVRIKVDRDKDSGAVDVDVDRDRK
jgi:uncharacterized protein YprB with RNaseH-like and TPR domain